MPAGTVRLPLADFWAQHGEVVTAIASVVLAVVVATLLDRAFARRGHSVAEAVTRGHVSAVLDTRLRFIRRLVYAGILIIGLMVAASQFTGLSKLAASILASGALAAAIIGFAARQTFANVVAGIMLAITQPLRVGDWVTFDGEYGVVEDVRLNYTILRTPGDVRVVIPNELLAAGVLRNDTPRSERGALDNSPWLPAGAPTRPPPAPRAAADRSPGNVAPDNSRRARTRSARSPRSPTRPAARQASPRSPPTGSASPSRASPCRPPTAGHDRPSCAPSASGGCARMACSRPGNKGSRSPERNPRR